MTARMSLRCAIYTRKSSEEGLEQDFNSLHAQREACEAYIKSQAHEGWRLIRDAFDDGGISGGTLERPGLQQLLDKVKARQIDIIVVYKIDRLTRSLADFARLADLFEEYGVSFVSVTQQFNTTSSMGRLMLNVLLSFAQFEREVTGERIRDKIAASKKKGLWIGGTVPLGYDAKGRTLVINKDEAETVRILYRLYLELGAVRAVRTEAKRLGLKTKKRKSSGGADFFPGHIYSILKNPLYAGRIQHRNAVYPGQHDAIIDPATWDAVQQQIAANRTGDRRMANSKYPSPLAGLVFDIDGKRFTPTHSSKPGRRYRYYVDQNLRGDDAKSSTHPRRLPARDLENAVRQAVLNLLVNSSDLLNALGNEIEVEEAGQAIRQGTELHNRFAKDSVGIWADLIRPLLDRVVFTPEGLHLKIKRNALRQMLSLPLQQGDCEDIDIFAPIKIRTRGGQLKLLISKGDAMQQHQQDAALIKAVVRAHNWFQQLTQGEAASIRAIASAEGLTGSYVSRIIRLAFLAPDIVEAILDGRHPIDLTAERLILREDITPDWREQRKQLGFERGQV